MEWFEKEYKKRFDGETTLEGVDPDQLWKNVSASLPKQKISFLRKWSTWLLFFIVLFLIGGIATWKVLQDPSPSELSSIAETSSLSPDPLSSSQLNTNQSLGEVSEVNSERMKETLPSGKKNEPNTQSTTPLTIDSKEESKLSSRNQRTPGLSITENDNFSPINVQRETVQLDQNKSIVAKDESIKMPNDIIAKNEKQTEEGVDLTGSIEENVLIGKTFETVNSGLNSGGLEEKFENSRSFTPLSDLKVREFKALAYKQEIEPSEIKPFNPGKSQINPWAIQFNTQIEFFDLTYSDATNGEAFAKDANAAQGGLQIGNSGEFLLEYTLNNRWSISTGFSIHKWENQLNTTLISDTTALDALQVERKAKAIRTVVHHNKLTTFSVPLQLNYNWQLSSDWIVGGSLRVGYHGMISQRGRILSRENTILDYDKDQNRQVGAFYSFGVRPFLRFEASDLISVQLNVGISSQSLGMAEVQELNQSALVYSGGMGIRIKL